MIGLYKSIDKTNNDIIRLTHLSFNRNLNVFLNKVNSDHLSRID